jgi:hypothetical protein
LVEALLANGAARTQAVVQLQDTIDDTAQALWLVSRWELVDVEDRAMTIRQLRQAGLRLLSLATELEARDGRCDAS